MTTKKIALFIDADNISAKFGKQIIEALEGHGSIFIRRIYGNWEKIALHGWNDCILNYSLRPIQQIDFATGKNATDMSLTIDAMDVLYGGKAEVFALVSNDSDFTPLALRLRESGKKVYGIGEKKTPKPFITACDKFIYVEILADIQTEEKPDGKALMPPQAQQQQKKPVSAKTVRFLAQCILESSGESGQSQLSALGSMISKKKPDFDSRNYGYSQLSKMLRAIPRFEVGGAGAHVWVKDKEAK